MRYTTNCQFHNLDFHDSPVSKIDIEKGCIRVYLEFANILREHVDNPHSVAKCIDNCVLTFHGVTKSLASVYNDETKIFEEHQYPTAPIDEEILEAISSVNEEGVVSYTLKGFHSTGWTEWHIISSGFELSWSSYSQDAWFVDRPPKSS
ncbi:TPA: hypothetical protein RQK41_004427 [Vibrio vulnificus]|uniref:hypothetical protein n=1 Tax=Vibrio vulnificus TaxID=672 RepID=UPI0019D432FC|nr:hypothetical protein [Vibrio vulnificus]MBN8147686.1 hypothetical protein [Vibrio vulnificus]HAS6163864.1 hypothetical protein [Vibrio vulnificus]HDY7878489.1 hypothetical protein [Vibrio vulnificus]